MALLIDCFSSESLIAKENSEKDFIKDDITFAFFTITAVDFFDLSTSFSVIFTDNFLSISSAFIIIGIRGFFISCATFIAASLQVSSLALVFSLSLWYFKALAITLNL